MPFVCCCVDRRSFAVIFETRSKKGAKRGLVTHHMFLYINEDKIQRQEIGVQLSVWCTLRDEMQAEESHRWLHPMQWVLGEVNSSTVTSPPAAAPAPGISS